MALSNLDPVTREETILNGDKITPANRGEYFLQKAVNKVPTPDGATDAGKVPTVNSAGDGFTLETPVDTSPLFLSCSGVCEFTSDDGVHTWTIPIDVDPEIILACFESPVRLVFVRVPHVFSEEAPYYNYSEDYSVPILQVYKAGQYGADISIPAGYNADNVTYMEIIIEDGSAALYLTDEVTT